MKTLLTFFILFALSSAHSNEYLRAKYTIEEISLGD